MNHVTEVGTFFAGLSSRTIILVGIFVVIVLAIRWLYNYLRPDRRL